jgi:integral membrane sensor domain MASE1
MVLPKLPVADNGATMRSGPAAGRNSDWRRWLMQVLLIALAYYLLAQLNMLLSHYLGSELLFWPSGGLALAALLLCGLRCWPGITLGIALILGLSGSDWQSMLVVVAVNTVFPVLAAWVISRWYPGVMRLRRMRDAIAFVVIGTVLGPLGNAVVGQAAMWAVGRLPLEQAGYQTLHWWLGDVLGVLLIAPPILAWAGTTLTRIKPHKLAPPLALLVLTAVLLLAVFGYWWSSPTKHLPLAFLLLPLLAWAALRYGLRGATALNLVICFTAAWSTDQGFGPFALLQRDATVEFIWLFIAICSLMALFVGTAVEAQRLLVRELEHALAEVHELKGLLPICANCKKIRDDQGYWQIVETYISQRTAAQFTHSLCPACVEKLYPGLELDLPDTETAA